MNMVVKIVVANKKRMLAFGSVVRASDEIAW